MQVGWSNISADRTFGKGKPWKNDPTKVSPKAWWLQLRNYQLQNVAFVGIASASKSSIVYLMLLCMISLLFVIIWGIVCIAYLLFFHLHFSDLTDSVQEAYSQGIDLCQELKIIGKPLGVLYVNRAQAMRFALEIHAHHCISWAVFHGSLVTFCHQGCRLRLEKPEKSWFLWSLKHVEVTCSALPRMHPRLPPG